MLTIVCFLFLKDPLWQGFDQLGARAQEPTGRSLLDGHRNVKGLTVCAKYSGEMLRQGFGVSHLIYHVSLHCETSTRTARVG
jgi:hypothetical protein